MPRPNRTNRPKRAGKILAVDHLHNANFGMSPAEAWVKGRDFAIRSAFEDRKLGLGRYCSCRGTDTLKAAGYSHVLIYAGGHPAILVDLYQTLPPMLQMQAH